MKLLFYLPFKEIKQQRLLKTNMRKYFFFETKKKNMQHFEIGTLKGTVLFKMPLLVHYCASRCNCGVY